LKLLITNYVASIIRHFDADSFALQIRLTGGLPENEGGQEGHLLPTLAFG
jgi:hypothetical protein